MLFSVIYADPPWKYSFEPQKRKLPYPSVPTDELCMMGQWVRSLCTKDCVIYMWATAPKLDDALLVLEAWGFRHKTNMAWDKVRTYPGRYHSGQHELLLIGGRGRSAPTVDGRLAAAVQSVIRERKTYNSRKPEQMYKIIESLYPSTWRLELFARCPKVRRRWRYWGNQVGTRQVLRGGPSKASYFRGLETEGVVGVVSKKKVGKMTQRVLLTEDREYGDPGIA